MPFAGIPPELAERAQRILDREPPADPEVPAFSHRAPAPDPFTFRRFLWPSRWSLLVALLLVALETAALLAGPLLVQVGIDRGVTAGDLGVVVVVSLAYLGVIIANVVLGWARTNVTVRIGERLMLRVGDEEYVFDPLTQRGDLGVLQRKVKLDENLPQACQ